MSNLILCLFNHRKRLSLNSILKPLKNQVNCAKRFNSNVEMKKNVYQKHLFVMAKMTAAIKATSSVVDHQE
jgi:hypothetical protein